jgi:hypothetical protein
VGRRPDVISPLAPLFRRDGIDIALVCVELWPQQTIVRLAALVEDPIGQEDTFAERLDARATGGRRGPIPEEPGERLYRDVSLSLSDDLGNHYLPKSSAVGGTGRLFRGDWHFPRGVPLEANRLLVDAGDAGGNSGSASPLMRRSPGWLAIRVTLAVSLFAVGISAGLARGSHPGGTDRLTTTVTTNGQVTTIVTGP